MLGMAKRTAGQWGRDIPTPGCMNAWGGEGVILSAPPISGPIFGVRGGLGAHVVHEASFHFGRS